MIYVSDEPLADSLMAQRLMRPVSKSIGANSLLHYRQRSATQFSSSVKEITKPKKRSKGGEEHNHNKQEAIISNTSLATISSQ